MVYALPLSYTPNLSTAALEADRQLLFVAKEYMLAGDKTNCLAYLTQVQTDINLLVTACTAATNASLSAGAGAAANTTGQ